jgi:transglutaminase-like putative cysteine protease
MATRELPVSVALAALSATVALAFGAIFASDAYVGPLIGAALLPHAIGWIVRRWNTSQARGAVVSGVGLVVYAAGLVGTPGPATGSRLADRIQAGWAVLRTDSVPIRATDGTVLLAVLVIWLVASVADDLAFRHHLSVGALAPALMAVIWVRALGSHHGWVPSTLGFGVAAVAFLALQHQVLLGRGRTRVGHSAGGLVPRLLAIAIGGGLVAVLVGAAVAPALPGGDHALLDLGNLGTPNGDSSYRTGIAPLVNIGDQLRQGARHELFTVKASQPDYWRITALDEYSPVGGGQWTLTARGNGAVGQGLSGVVPRGALHQAYRIGLLGERWMPAAYEPLAVNRSDTLVVRASTTLVTAQSSVSGLAYTVDSRLPTRSATLAERAATTAAVPASLRRYLALPANIPPDVRATAQRVVGGRTNPYDQAAALRDFFRNGSFVYDPNVLLGDDEGAMSRFLAERRGFCVQFASTYAVMARLAGIPARVAVGFTPGTVDATSTYHVTNYEAHAWPEVWLAGLGWTHLFDPTPASSLPGGSALPGEPPNVTANSPQATPVPATTPAPTPAAPGAPGGSGAGAPPAAAPSRGVTVTRTGTNRGRSVLAWVLLIAGLVALGTLLTMAVVMTRKARRRTRRRSASDPTALIAGAWAEVLDELSEAGVAWPASLTPLEVASGVPGRVVSGIAPPLTSLARAYTAARYGDAAPPPGSGEAAWRDADAVLRALDASLDVRTRLRAHLGTRGRRAQPDPAGWSLPRSRSTKV